ncbi:5-formyltetrahydrofolate cyclo-ligase [Salinimicrobium catena]|uniref:5-formyltetrahydrofolate cyclo-ligase n=1 Tax=Salinimicrobium catena TaxID=390640 RepID=A0A1H5J6K0_9FLAO|nr:5-formyltetrahydrofolate cyclo-ligase [Salinimicrobium catena]SDK84340.1 5-formyltetrahydrofolate cyclo-ligase [Salinimicrobium catena]SEE47681.1 5-formyltetrahydrofolate cyclo-ligase [Salinimicrobium catena]
MNKDQIRLQYKKLRENISPEEIEHWSLEIANNLLKLPIWDHSYYHLFLSISEKREVDTQAILHILQGKDKNVVLSKADFKSGKMLSYLLTDSTVIKTNSWGIPEPVEGIEIPPSNIEVVFIPLLAFDEGGNRIGYGKGFYDRFLSECTGKVVKVGLSFFEAEKEEIPATSEDVPLDYCVTPHKIYNFKNL